MNSLTEVMGPGGVGSAGAVRGGVFVGLSSGENSLSAAADRLYQFDQLSRWLAREELGVGDLSGGQAERFALERRVAGVVSWSAPLSVALPLEFLRQVGAVPPPALACPNGSLEELLADYGRYLSIERGLCDHTVFDAYVPASRLFLSELGTGRHVRVLGKERATPLTSEVATLLRAWITERAGGPDDPLFPTRQGGPLSRFTLGLLVGNYADTAAFTCPSLKAKHVTPHVLRHTAAMAWRATGVDLATIALLLGHQSVQTTHIYEHADPALKEEEIARTAPLGSSQADTDPPTRCSHSSKASDYVERVTGETLQHRENLDPQAPRST